VNDQLTVWFDDENKHGAIVPTIIPAGTVTRRAVEKLWLTASNPKVRFRSHSAPKPKPKCCRRTGWAAN
jgi:hypothetical protein